MKRENKFQAELVRDIRNKFPECEVLKNDPNYILGIPDLTILCENKWAILEVKRSAKSAHQPNQDYYVNRFNDMSYSSFVYPENKETVLNELHEHFKSE